MANGIEELQGLTAEDCIGDDAEYVTCWQCGGEGFSHHDCGEDTCCCRDPEPNVTCDICKGEGTIRVVPTANEESTK
ncbi:MAG: hypothetical protein ACYTEQ_03475 [Planctomycetota bacterium]|jgi:hypothetical protein